MRGFKSLSGIAGPGASLAQAGGGGVSGPQLIGLVGHTATFDDPTAYSLDISALGHKAGDLLFTMTYGFYGRITDPIVTTPGHVQIAASADVGVSGNKSLAFMKVATGDEVAVAAPFDGQFGIAVVAIRGVPEPSVTDLATSTAYCETGSSSVDHAAMSDLSFDFSLVLAARKNNEKTPLLSAVQSGAHLGLAGALLAPHSSNLASAFLLSGDSAAGSFRAQYSSSTTEAVVRIGLRGS